MFKVDYLFAMLIIIVMEAARSVIMVAHMMVLALRLGSFGQCYFAFTVTSLYYQLLISSYQHSFICREILQFTESNPYEISANHAVMLYGGIFRAGRSLLFLYMLSTLVSTC